MFRADGIFWVVSRDGCLLAHPGRRCKLVLFSTFQVVKDDGSLP